MDEWLRGRELGPSVRKSKSQIAPPPYTITPVNAERRFINQLRPGEMVDQVFLVRDRDLRTTSKGALYIACTLGDKTGKVNARMWQASEAIFRSMPVDGFIQVKGRTENYKGQLQLIIDALRPRKAEKIDLADFLACAAGDPEQMWAELLAIVREIKNRPLRMLIKKFIEDRELVDAFKRAPAAMEMHQAYIGGLLEHTLQVARSAKAIVPLYPELNPGLLLAGVFLHDIGKTAELTSDLGFRYTDQGQLVGHITLAAIWVQQAADAISAETGEPFPQKTIDLLQHLILSHHGCHEYGSPKLPMIPEAAALHYLDNLDAKMHMFAREITNDADPNNSFTNYQHALQVRIYKRSRQLDDDAPSGLFAQPDDE